MQRGLKYFPLNIIANIEIPLIMKKIILNMAKLQIILQLVIAISPALTVPSSLAQNDTLSPFSVDRGSRPSTAANNVAPYSSQLATAASTVANANPTMAGASWVTGHAANTVEQWLNQFGTARVQLNVDDQGHWDNSALDFLAPVYNSKKAMLFTQLGVRAPDGRVTGNLGGGIRTFYLDDWMLGGNLFIDNDFTGKNRRIGMGAEAWTNNLKLSANSYFAITQWHDSRDFDNYEEKPANGYDIRAEGYLPSYPQLGGKLMYEKYYSDDVALFDKDTLQSDPSAVTVGVNYTPVPLITVGVDYKRGQNSMDETTIGVNLRYTIGQPWAQQISPEQVALQRSLAGSRYDLVDRNNEIVMQYKKKPVDNVLTDMQITSPKDNSPADGVTANIISVKASTSKGTPASNAVINWTVSGQGKLSAVSSVTDANGVASVSVTNQSAEQVVVTASSGSITRSTPSIFSQPVAAVDLQITKNNSQANGSDQNIGRVVVKDAKGQPMSGITIQWKVNNSAVIVSSDKQSNDQGQAEVHFTRTTAGDVSLSVDASGKTASVDSTFAATTQTSVAVIMTKNGSQADGTTANVAQATVIDANGKAMAGVPVTWSVTGSAVPASSSSTTDTNGNATMNFTDSTVESNLTVTANAEGQSASATTQFVGITVASVAVTLTKDYSVADGSDVNVAQATVTDSNGKAMAGVIVNWSASGSATPAASSSTTDTNGHATMNFIDTTVESNLTVTATAAGKSGTATTNFTVKMGDVTVAYPGIYTQINHRLADNGLRINVSYPGMAVGDEVRVNFTVAGTLNPLIGKQTLPNYDFAVYTVTSADIGKTLTFTVPSTEVTDLEPATPNSLKGTATAVVTRPSNGTQKIDTVTSYVDTH